MYSLDVNFLKDRRVEEDPKKTIQGKREGFSVGKNLPMLIGLGVMVLLPAAAASLLLIINSQTASTQERITELDSEISQLGAQNQKVQEVEKQVSAVNEETQALVSVFNQIKPWSAVLQDIRDRVPSAVQIQSISQGTPGSTTTTPQGQAQGQAQTSTPGAIELTIVGFASSYNDVNDFVLSLQQSNFLSAEKTRLTNAELADAPIEGMDEEERNELSARIRQGQFPGIPTDLSLVDVKETYSFPQVVKYEIKTQLGDIPASKLMPELARKGAVGLVTRIRTLEQKGAIQP
jgi:type IV pilus assembly protein PilN